MPLNLRLLKSAFAVLLSVSTLLCLSYRAASSPPGKAAGLLRKPHTAGEILVRFNPRFRNTVEEFIKSRGVTIRTRFTGKLDGLVLVKLNNADRSEEVLSALLQRADVTYAEPNYLVEPAALPDDPEFWRCWGLHNTGQRYKNFPGRRGTEDIDIDAPEAWDITTGSGDVIIAVIDTGVNYSHPDLSANIWTNPGEIPGNGVDDESNGFIDDVHGMNFADANNDPSDPDGHGTSVASTACMAGNNGTGACGVCWNVSVMPVRVNLGESSSMAQIITGIQYAVSNGAHVINASWGTSSFSQSLYDAINLARSANIVFVAAAGNNSANIDVSCYYPASYGLDNIISVAAVNSNGNLANFSSYGPTAVDIAAPGVDIYAADGGSYTYFSGTSAAAPVVSGVAALVISANPGIPCAETCTRIISSANRLTALEGRCVSSGMLNAYNALNIGQPAVVVDSVSQYVLGTGGTSTITWTCKHDGTYSVEAGGNGSAGSGSVIAAGTCQLDEQILTVVSEADLPDNQASLIYIIIPEALYSGFATVTLHDDQTGPSSQIEYPAQSSTLGTLSEISGTAQDTGGGEVSAVSVAVHDGSFYYNGAAFISTDPVYISASGTTSWSFDASPVPWADSTAYTIYAQAQDTLANIAYCENPVTFTYLAGAPTVRIESVSTMVLGTGQSSTVTWRSDLAGSYSLEAGGTGAPGSGVEVESGACAADTPVNSLVSGGYLTNNSVNTLYTYVTSASITGSVSFILYDDQAPPYSNIIQPLNNQIYSELNAVLGRADDLGEAGVASVEVQITDGLRYWDGIQFADAPAWVMADGTTEWSLSTSSVPWTDFARYTVKTRATDSVGNVETPSGGVEFVFNSGNTILKKKDSGGCNLSNSEDGMLSIFLLLVVFAAFCTVRRRRIGYSG